MVFVIDAAERQFSFAKPAEMVSVVVTCYNQAHFLNEAINIAAAYSGVRYIHQNNCGVATARNTGIKLEYADPEYQLLIAVKATKPSDDGVTQREN
jgi:hypothetical protein